MLTVTGGDIWEIIMIQMYARRGITMELIIKPYVDEYRHKHRATFRNDNVY